MARRHRSTTPSARPARGTDNGIAMFAVLAATAIASLLVLASMSTVVGTVHRSTLDRNREQAIQLAEAGANRAIALLDADPTYSTVSNPPATITKEWVLAMANLQTPEQGREGQFVWVVPLGRDVVFGVGYTPSKANPASTRVIQLDVQRIAAPPRYVFLAASDAEFTGQTHISGGSNVHANGDLDLGNGAYVSGTASATGSVRGAGSAATMVSGAPTVAVPPVAASQYRDLTTHDLCPDGTVRQGGTIPCTGSIVAIPTGGTRWNGWRYRAAQSEWDLVSAPGSRVYVYRANVSLGPGIGTLSDPWIGNLVVESLVVGGVKVNGDIDGGQLPAMRAAFGDVAIVTERDLRLGGGGTIWGNVYVGEHMWYVGSGTVYGRILISGTTDSASSLLSTNRFVGGATIVDNTPSTGQAGGMAVDNWTEL